MYVLVFFGINCISHHGSTVYVEVVMAVWIRQYAVIQWKPRLVFYRVKTGQIKVLRRKCALYRDSDTCSST